MSPSEELVKIYYNVIEMVEEAFEDNQVVINILTELLHERISAVIDDDAKVFPLQTLDGNAILYTEPDLESDVRQYRVMNKATGFVVARGVPSSHFYNTTQERAIENCLEYVFYLEDILTMPKSFLDPNCYMLVEIKEV